MSIKEKDLEPGKIYVRRLPTRPDIDETFIFHKILNDGWWMEITVLNQNGHDIPEKFQKPRKAGLCDYGCKPYPSGYTNNAYTEEKES